MAQPQTVAPRDADPSLALDLRNLPFDTDDGLDARAKVGLLVLASDGVIEAEFRRVFEATRVALYGSRIRNDPSITPETLKRMEQGLAASADLILPGVALDVVGYGCTSASMVIGEEKVAARIREARPGVACTTPMTAAVAAFKALGVSRVALFTPYIDEINQAMRRHIEARGFTVTAMGSFNEEDDPTVARITLDSVQRAALQVGAPDEVEAVFVSCTNLRLLDGAAALEARLGKPVTSSNHAMAWHCLRLAGIADSLPQFGRLFTLGLDGRPSA